MTPRSSDSDYFSMVVTTFLPQQFIGALSYAAIISELNSALPKLLFTVYRLEIGRVGLSDDYF